MEKILKNKVYKMEKIWEYVLGTLVLVWGSLAIVLLLANSGIIFNQHTVEITFHDQGNSAQYINSKDGWGEQEEKWRCAIGKNTTISLPINVGNSIVQFSFYGFGVYNPNQTGQKVTLFVNEQRIISWDVNELGWYSTTIPASVVKAGQLNIEFKSEAPYSPTGDIRKLSMAIQKIVIKKPFAWETKNAMANWFKKQFESSE